MSPPKPEHRQLTPEELTALADEMRSEGGPTIKSRTMWFSTYPSCFVGCDAIDWMINKGKASDRAEALAFGRQLVEADLIHHVKDSATFTDDKSWFRFRADDVNYDGMAYWTQAKNCVKHGAVQVKKGSGSFELRAAILQTEPTPRVLIYDSQVSAKPSKVIELKQAGLDVAECEDCKKDWHCFTLSGGEEQIRYVICTQHSRDQQAWMDALIAQGVTLQRENLHTTANSLFEFNAARHDGTVVQFTEYTGKQFVALYNKYHDRGFEILAFPSNEFGRQEPKSNEEIQSFVAKRGVTFPVFAKTTVNGQNAHPVFNFLRSKLSGLLGSYIKWNFTKFLCDRDGIPIIRYAPTTKPFDCEDDIVKLLDKPATVAEASSSGTTTDGNREKSSTMEAEEATTSSHIAESSAPPQASSSAPMQETVEHHSASSSTKAETQDQVGEKKKKEEEEEPMSARSEHEASKAVDEPVDTKTPAEDEPSQKTVEQHAADKPADDDASTKSVEELVDETAGKSTDEPADHPTDQLAETHDAKL